MRVWGNISLFPFAKGLGHPSVVGKRDVGSMNRKSEESLSNLPGFLVYL